MIHKCNWFQARLPQVRNYRGIADVEALIKSTEALINSTEALIKSTGPWVDFQWLFYYNIPMLKTVELKRWNETKKDKNTCLPIVLALCTPE